jgi:hypothetical protein
VTFRSDPVQGAAEVTEVQPLLRDQGNKNATVAWEKRANKNSEAEGGRVRVRYSMNSETVLATVSVAGSLIRYAFYLVAALVVGGIGLIVLWGWNYRVKPVDAQPALRLASSSLAHLPVSGHVVSSGLFGRIEVRQYGRLHNRDVDLAIVMVMPPKGVGLGTQFAQDLRDINLLRGARATLLNANHDLENRFGEFRATEMRVDADGRWKNCLAFRSRLDTAAVYFTGWYCDGSGAKPSAGALACMLDRMTLDTDLAAKEADAFIRARMARPARCSAEPVTQTTDVRQQRLSPPSRWSQPTARRY